MVIIITFSFKKWGYMKPFEDYVDLVENNKMLVTVAFWDIFCRMFLTTNR